MRTIPAIVCVLGLLASVASAVEDPLFEIRKLEILDHVGDPVVDAAFVQAHLDAVLQLDGFVRFRGKKERHSEFDTNGYHKIRNVFDAGGEPVDVELEIEIVYYGPRQENVDDAIMQAWVFGPILSGALRGETGLVMGLVQYRITVRPTDGSDAVTAIGQAVAAGDPLETPRAAALQEAANRAAWDLGYSLVSAMNEKWDLDLDRQFISAEFHEFERAIENWMKTH